MAAVRATKNHSAASHGHRHASSNNIRPDFIHSSSPEYSIVVDNVDEEPQDHQVGATSEASDNRQYVTMRIQEIQRAAEGRKLEFARLLEEHEQVIRNLNKMQQTDSRSSPNCAKQNDDSEGGYDNPDTPDCEKSPV